MRRQLHIAILAILVLTGCLNSPTNSRKEVAEQLQISGTDPKNTTYIIEAREVRLMDGRAVTEVVPGAASKTITAVFGEPVHGEVNGEVGDIVALILVQTAGGSGTFYYAAAAARGAGGTWRGSNAVFLGDRIAPQEIAVGKGVVIVTYLDRRPEQPMTAAPTTGQVTYLALKEGRLAEVSGAGETEKVLAGWVTIGHEVRSFLPCTEEADQWLSGGPSAMGEIMAAYRQLLPTEAAYQPLLMVLAGSFEKRPDEGFGADYPAAFRASRLVGVLPGGHCPNALIRVDTPVPNTGVASPLKVEGEALGPWFFEGDFPLLLTDGQGMTLARGYATSQGSWMTSGFVPFAGTLEFPPPASTGRYILVLRKDNPTGLPEHDDAVTLPLILKPNR
jgi:hypothetical protein